MLKFLLTMLPLVLFSQATLAAPQVFTVDVARSKVTLRLIDVGGVDSAPVDVSLDGEFAIDIGAPTAGAATTDPKNWNVSAGLIKDDTIAPVSAVITAPQVTLSANGVVVTIDTLVLTGFSVGNNYPPTTLAGGPPVSSGSQTTNAEFVAAGDIQIGPTSVPIPNTPTQTADTAFSIELADADQLGGANGNTVAHITATTAATITTTAAAGQLEVVLDMYGHADYNGTVNPAPATGGGNSGGSGSSGDSSSSSSGAADWLLLSGLTVALLGIRHRDKQA